MSSATTEAHRPEFSDVAVVVATRNDASHLPACIESLLPLREQNVDLIFVNDGSTDETPKILSSYEDRIQIVDGGGLGPGHARNLALKYTERCWIAFTDSDCVVAESWLRELLQGIRERELVYSSVGGMQIVPKDAGRFETLVGDFFGALGFVSDYVHTTGKVRDVLHNPTCNVLYDRKALEKVGGFDELLWPCEDLELDLRLKKLEFKALYQPKAIVAHRRPSSVSAFLGMMNRYGFAHAQLVKKHGLCQKIHALPVLVPLSIMVLWFYLAKAWGPLEPFVIAWIVVAVWAILRVRTHGLLYRFTFGVFFTPMLVGAILTWVMGFYRGLLGQRRVARQHA